MTYFQLKKYIASSLADVAGEYASYEAEKAVCHLYGIDRRTLLLCQREEAPDKTEETENIIARRKNGEPLAYIIEKTDFFGLELVVIKLRRDLIMKLFVGTAKIDRAADVADLFDWHALIEQFCDAKQNILSHAIRQKVGAGIDENRTANAV